MKMQTSAMNRIVKMAALGLLPLATLTALAQDDGRLDRIESEIQALKLRLSNIEAAQAGSAVEQNPMAAGLGWKSISSWRQLKTGMNPNEVRAILGEPVRVNGGEIANWYYANGGVSTFMGDKLYRWVEPNR